MIDFFKVHQQDLIYSIFVIVIVIILRVLTNMLHKWVVKEKKRKFPTEAPKSTNLLKKNIKCALDYLRNYCSKLSFCRE